MKIPFDKQEREVSSTLKNNQYMLVIRYLLGKCGCIWYL